jgi:hypothetical protein
MSGSATPVVNAREARAAVRASGPVLRAGKRPPTGPGFWPWTQLFSNLGRGSWRGRGRGVQSPFHHPRGALARILGSRGETCVALETLYFLDHRPALPVPPKVNRIIAQATPDLASPPKH